MQEARVQSLVRKIPWRRAWQPTPVFLLAESHEQRSLAGYSPWGHRRVRHDRSDLIYTFLGGKGSQYMYYKQKEKALFSSISKGSSTRTSAFESVFSKCHLKNTERRKLEIRFFPKHPHPVYKYTHFYSTHLLYMWKSDHEGPSDGKCGDWVFILKKYKDAFHQNGSFTPGGCSVPISWNY